MNRQMLISIASKLLINNDWITADQIRQFIANNYHIIKTTDEITDELRSLYKQTRENDKVMFSYRTNDNSTEFQISQPPIKET